MIRNTPLVSILITNFNYGSFVAAAIDSALGQTYENIEVLVVDDGSSDDSRDVISAYGRRITPLFKENGGHASALNAGFAASRGELLCLLDADDFFFPHKVERVVSRLEPHTIFHNRMELRPGPGFIPAKPVVELDAYRYAQRYGYFPFNGSPTSGISIQRDLARRLMPIPNVRVSADDFLVRGAALVGKVEWIDEALGAYRVHGANEWFGSFQPKSLDYMREIEAYLNGKLVESGKAPVVDFYGGMYGIDYVPQDAGTLLRLGLRVFSRHPTPFTLRFALETGARALALTSGRNTRPGSPKRPL